MASISVESLLKQFARTTNTQFEKETTMSCNLNKSIVAAIACALIISPTIAAAGEKCSGSAANTSHVNTVAYAKETKMDIVDTAVNAGSFTKLAAALQAAGLVETLKGEGPFTVFAPTDEAFAKLPAGTVETLLKPENKEKLTGILTYHVVAGKVMAADVVKLQNAKTVQGSEVGIKVDGGKVMVDGANVIKTDIECENGVIHVIDAVIMP